MKKSSVGSFRKKAVLTRKTAMAATSIVLALALIATVAFGLIPDTAIKASADTIGLISSVSGKNYLPDTYTAVNVPAGTYKMSVSDYNAGKPVESDGVAAFDFHIFAKDFASKAHTCGNIAVENLGGSAAGASGAPEFGSRPNHDTNSIKLSYVENIHDWSTSAQADAFVFGPGNTVTENQGQVFVNTPDGNYMMGNGKELMDKTYIDDATPFIDIDKELQDAEDYQRYLVWLMEDIETRAANYYYPGWGYATKAANGETVRVLTHPDVAGWGWFGTTIDFSQYPEDTIIVDLDLYEGMDWWGNKSVGSNAQNLINGSVTLKGTAGKRIIFNVESSSGFNADCIKFADTNMKADQMGNSEDSVKLDNNILWNFYQKDSGVPNSTTGTITVGGTWMGTILAPDATVKCGAGLNGSIIAREVTTSAETHKSDYTGEKVTKSDVTTFPVTKIWQDDPLTRPEFITIKLLQNNKAYKTIQLSANTEGCTLSDFDSTGKYAFQWNYVFTGLPTTDGRGVSYRYDIEEVVPAGYTSNIVDHTIINTNGGRQEPNAEPKLATLTFNKRPDGKPDEFLKGAQFKMTIDNGSSLAEVTAVSGAENFKATDGEVTWTSTDAAAVFANLPYGTYTITETKAPAGYLTANPVTVKVDGETAKADMNDKPVEVKLAKLESVNKDMLPGAELKLTADWGQNLSGVEITGGTDVNKSSNSITWTSDKGVVTIKGIAPGSYTLSETKAPMGYDLAAPVTFIVENDGTVKVNGTAVSRVEMIDTLTPAKEPDPVYYNITINKVNEAKTVSLPGAKLQLTAVGDIKLDNVTVTGAKDGTVVKSGNTITWETNGSAVSFGNLPEGSYTLSEIAAPEGYKTASPMNFTVSANGSYEMIDKAIEMSISKKDSASGAELAGATLTLTSKDGKSLAGVTVTGADKKDNSAISMPDSTITWTTDGSVVSFSGLPAGNYTLSESETGVPVGYKRAADIEFKVDAYGNVSGTNVSGNTCTMYDEPVIVKIAKQYSVTDAESGKPVTGNLAGAELQLTGSNDLSKVTGSITLAHPNANTVTWTSTSAANSLRGLPDGTYTLHEISAPEGFVLAQDITIVVEGGVVKSPTLNDNGEIVMTDEKEQFSSMVFTKIDADEYIKNNNVVLVEGAEMGVFKKDTVSFAPGNAELVFTSKTVPEKVMLPNGDYVLVELKAPEGYEKTDEKMYFTVNNGTLTVTSFDAAELASASYGKPSDEGLGVNEDCYYTLETTGIFEQYGRLPDKVHFTVDGTTQYYLNDFKLYKSDPSTTPPTETVVAEKDSSELSTSWDVSLPKDAVYDPSCTYYAVLKLADSNKQPLTSASTPKINLMFSYTNVSSEGASEQLATSTTGTYTVGNCNGQVLEITKSNIETYGYPEIVVSYNKDNAYANAYCNQSGLRLFINYVRADGGSDKQEKDIGPTSGLGDTSKGKDVVFSQAAIETAFKDMLSKVPDGAKIESYQIQMTTFAMQGAGNDSSSIPLDVTANYAGGGNVGGDVNVDIDIKDNFESKKEELSGSTSDTSDPIAVKIHESVGGETAYLVLPNYNTPVSYKNICAVEIIKTDASGNKITGSSASFLLYDENNNLVGSLYGTNGVYAYNADANTENPANTSSAPLKTNPDTGMLKVTGLDQGKYYLVEKDAPLNYEASENDTVFALTLSNIEANPLEVTVKNNVKKGHITLIKTDDNGTLKEGATFDLYRVKLSDINNSTPTGDKIGTYTTLNDGKYTVEVELGYLYYAIETVNGAPSGTVNSNVDVKLPKLDTNGPDASRYVINGYNVNYGVVLAEDIGTGNVKLQVVEKDASGNVVYVDKAVKEYDSAGNEIGTSSMDVYDGNIGAVNTSVKTTINKFDEDGQTPLAGAVLKLERTDVTSGAYSKPVFGEVKGSIDVTHYIEYVYVEDANGDLNLSINAEDKNERPFIKSEYITWTSGDAANILSGLPAGTYKLTELDAPEGYAVAEAKTFTVTTANGSVDMIDTKLTGSITLTKRDSVNNARIADVQFMLQVSDDGKAWTDTGKTYTTKADGTVTADGLIYGKYYRFKETSTPAGYKANEGDAIYTTSAQVTEEKLTSTVDFENTALTGSVTLTKVEKGNADVKLKDAEFQLYYKASTANDSTYILYSDETYTTDENGQIKVDNLPWGYTYRFKETKAPTGYAIDSENSTAVALTADDLNKTVTVENIKIVGSITLTGTKTIEGKDNVTQTFEFIVKEGDKTVATANNVGGAITFPAINYTVADIGDHTYKISESDYDADGIKSTDTTFTVTVNVALSQDGKSLVATIKEGSQNIAFVNTYTAEGVEATVNGTKTLNGKALTDGAFTFELYETGADFNTNGKTPQTTTNVNGAFSFTKAYDEAGTHYYVIKEQIPSETNGITYDTAEYRWTVVVKDNGTGALVIDSETLTKGGVAATSADFTNTYSTTAIGESVSGTKTLAGGRPEALKENEFTFELWNADETTKITEVKNAADGAFSFSQNYTAAGTYSYVIKEQIPSETNGIAYDEAEYVWTVVVKDNGTGALVVDSETLAKGGETATSADFTNTYSTTAVSESVSGKKTLAGGRPEALKENEFTFELWNADETTKITDVKNAADGSFTISQNYTAAGTYSYVIKEQIPSETNGITYDTAEYIWTVVVTDNGTGKLVVTSETLTKGGTTATSADFTNTYSATGISESVSGKKTLAGNRPEALKNAEFTFELWNADETTKITGVTNAADGTFTITQTYTAAGTYSYVIKEQIPANTNGIAYDEAEYVWTVVVKDNGTGALVVDSETLTKDGKTATSADFTNTYSATAVSESVSGKKTLAGGRPEALKENEFTFELWNADETEKITDVKNAADGSFTISQNYTAAGTYSYVIKEQIPTKTNGIAYDEAEYVWTVVVKDNGTGALVIESETLTKGGKAATSADFTNTYSTTAIGESVSGKKTLAGSRPEALKENEFTFELWNADETTKITETKNAADGAFSFSQNYTAAGTYSYVIKEQIPSETNGITYDTAEYVWTVVVKDNGTGALVVDSETLTKGGETATSADFTNTYSAQPVKATVDGLKNLDGAPTSKEFTFELWAADKDKKIIGTEAIATFTNGADGTFVIETEEFDAPGTHYFIVKERVPAGAVNNVYNGVTYDTTEKFWTVTITDNGSGNLVASKTVNEDNSEAVYTFNNTTATGTVSISKQKVGGGNDIDGAVLSITPVGDITFGSGITVSAAVKTVTGSNITWTSEKEAVSITGLPVGTYALTETVAPDGYALSEETIYFRIADDGKIYSVTEANYKADGTTEWKEVTDSTVIMEDAPYTAVFSKVDADIGEELPGATITVTPPAFADLSNVVLPEDVEIVNGAITWVSTDEPKTIGALPDGVYEFKEVQAPYGYAIAEVVYVKIDGDNVYSATKAEYDAEGFDWSEVTAAEGDRVKMVDDVNKAVFSKRAATVDGSELAGAILKLTVLDEGVTLDRVPEVSGVSLIESDKTLTWISDGTEKTISQLPNGVYEFTEIAAPSGYAPAETIYVKIDNGNVYSATKDQYNNGKIDWSAVTAANGDRVVMVDALNTAIFSKEGTDAGEELPGAIINIVPVVSDTDLSDVKKNAPKHVTVENGIISWESGTESTVLRQLPDGEYKFIEITAPSGYEVAEVIYVKIENGAVSSVPAKDYEGEDTEWVAANGNKVIMKDAPNTLVLSKQATDEDKELAGAELSLTPVTSGTDISGVKVPTGVDNKNNKITWISKKDAPLTLNMVPDGIYKFTEDKAPLGYELAETIYIKVENGDIFTVAEKNYAGEDTLWGSAAEKDTVLMEDAPTPEPNKVNFSFIKYSNIGTTVSGATFTLTGPDDFSASSTSNGTGGVAFTGLGEGVYTLVESACPPTYVKSEQIVYISVSAEGVITYKDATGKDIVHSDIETLMTNKIKPIEDEKKGNVGDVYNLYEQLLKEYKEYEDITITWESSDSSIIEVDQNGKATIKKVGQATITAKNGDTVLGTFVLGAEAVNGTEDETPNTGDTDAPQTGDVTTGWTIAVISLLGISAIVAKVSYDKIKRNAKNKAVR